MAVRGYSPATIENHRYNLTYLVLWLGDRGVSRPGEVTKPMLDRYQRAVFHHRKPDGTPLSFRSQVQRLTPVRALFKWLARQNRILYNPASELELPKAERRLPRAVLSQSEAERVAGVRSRHRALDVGCEAGEGLVADYVKRSGVGKPGACHLFRHTMATLMLEGGADIRFIQQMLGHADISTTQIHTQVSLRQLRAIHTATHPAAQNISRRDRPAGAGDLDGPTG